MMREELQFLQQLTERLVKLEKQFALLNTHELTTFTAFGRSLVDDADAAAARTTLGAVGLTGNETIAGNKTFTGLLTAARLVTGVATIADDAVHTYDIGTTQAGGLMFGSTTASETTVGGLFTYRATTTPHMTGITVLSNVNTTTGTLTGTTGTDTKFTVSCRTDGKIDFENRRGGSRAVWYVIFYGQ